MTITATTIKKNSVEKCERCKKSLSSLDIVWLEYNISDGIFYTDGTFPQDGNSQGFFPFGKDCAKKPTFGK